MDFRYSNILYICTCVFNDETILNSIFFFRSYAYTGRPVVVVDDSNAKRSANFGFQLFKNLSDSKLLTPCQFFPYKTEFKSLEEALNMDNERAMMTSGYEPWYIGWYVGCWVLGSIVSRY